MCLSATDMVIIYLSSGVTSRESSEQEKRATLSVVREENRHLNNSVMILTYALMNGTSPPRFYICPHLPHSLAAFNKWLNGPWMWTTAGLWFFWFCVLSVSERRLWVREVLRNLKGCFSSFSWPVSHLFIFLLSLSIYLHL